MIRRPPRSPLFPSTPLSRSLRVGAPQMAEHASPASAVPVSIVVAVPEARRPSRLGRLLEREHILAGVVLPPPPLIPTPFLPHPLVLRTWLAIIDKGGGRARALPRPPKLPGD